MLLDTGMIAIKRTDLAEFYSMWVKVRKVAFRFKRLLKIWPFLSSDLYDKLFKGQQ